jgi:hypothetical protein
MICENARLKNGMSSHRPSLALAALEEHFAVFAGCAEIVSLERLDKIGGGGEADLEGDLGDAFLRLGEHRFGVADAYGIEIVDEGHIHAFPEYAAEM